MHEIYRRIDSLPKPCGVSGHQGNDMAASSLHILIVEDNAVNRLILGRNLSKMGFEVDVAENGYEAIHMLDIQNYDMILMDINMPVMNGIEATEIIRKKLGLSTPIISITANTLEVERKKFFQAGINDYLTKPFRTDALLNMIYKHLAE